MVLLVQEQETVPAWYAAIEEFLRLLAQWVLGLRPAMLPRAPCAVFDSVHQVALMRQTLFKPQPIIQEKT